MIKGAIFDVDGTLLDSMQVWDTVAERYLQKIGISADMDVNREFKQMSLYQGACYLKENYGLIQSVDEIMAGVNTLIEDFYIKQVLRKPGIAEYLEVLSAQNVKLCVATATDEYLVEAALRRNGILKYFQKIFTCTGVGSGKDEPKIFYQALDFLGTDLEETLVFEDALYAARTVKAAGFPLAAVYDSHEEGQQELKEIADYYIKDFRNAEGIVK